MEDAHDPARRRWRFSFQRVAGCANVLEEFRCDLRATMSGTPRIGSTRFIAGSPWAGYLLRTEGMLELVHPQLRHYQISTEDDVIDIVTSTEPSLEGIEPAVPGSPPAGKSIVVHFKPNERGVRRAASDALVGEIRATYRSPGPPSP